jgi:N-formylglutamate amidohydrolase
MKRRFKKAVLALHAPRRASSVVADSPHSGRDYPADFGFSAPLHELRKAEDSYLDIIFDFMPDIGVPLLEGLFPRSYIDTNRADDISSVKNRDGVYHPTPNGIARSRCTPRCETPVYDRPVSLREMFNRVAGYYKPYHRALKEMIDATAERAGKVVHLNLHSMPSTSKKGTAPNPYDIIIGTRDGQTAADDLALVLRDLFAARGFRVGINVPGYKGQEIVERSGNPAHNRHSVQLEISRALYMDEETLVMHDAAAIAGLKAQLRDVMSAFRDYCDERPPAPQPKCRPR